MKKILIFSHAMEIGGAERALLGLLETIDTTKYEVDLFLMRHEGELLKYIPEGIHLLPEISQYTCLAVPFTNVIRKKQLGMAAGRIVAKWKAKRRVNELQLPRDNEVELEYSHKYTVPFVPQVSDICYDAAISFLTPHYFVAQKVKAKMKIAWIHTDYANVTVDRESQLRMWDCYDRIASISDDVTVSFLKLFPELRRKIVLLPNIIPSKLILKMANEGTVQDEMPKDGSVRLLSVGRFCNAKNFDSVPAICKKIRENGANIKWYLIGYGNDEQLIRDRMIAEEMQEYVIILGKKANPYPYFKNCDLYIQPSRYEGKCVSVIEAQILNKPVIITNYSTAGSQLSDGEDGIIVPRDIQGCADGITAVIQNKVLQEKLIEQTEKRDYTNTDTIDCLYRLIESENEN